MSENIENKVEITPVKKISITPTKLILGAIVYGIGASTISDIIRESIAPHEHATYTAIMQDVNKDSIADIINYDSNGKYINTLIGVKDSSKTIDYIDAKQLMDQRYQADKNKYNQEKSQLEKQIEQYKR